MIFWMNLYRSGYYHRDGKPGTLPWHPGDVYASREAALDDVDHEAPYLGTVWFAVDVGAVPLLPHEITPYNEASKPLSMLYTREQLRLESATQGKGLDFRSWMVSCKRK